MVASLTVLQMAQSTIQHQTLAKIDKFIWSCTMPSVLLYGDSHLTHLKKWYKLPNLPRIPYKPTSLDKKPLDSCTWCAVPGTRFDTIHDKVSGNDIPGHQEYLGDQWGDITVKNKIDPVYIICSLGGNDVSDFDTSLKKKLAEQQIALQNAARGFGDTSMADFDTVKFWNEKKEELHGHIDKVYERLGNTFPDAKIGHFGLLIRDEWCDASIRMAENLDWYIHNVKGVKILKINDFVNHSHLKRDGVHLNNKGFRLFMDQIFSSLLNSYLQKEMIRRRRQRQEEDRRLKALARERREACAKSASRRFSHQIQQGQRYQPYHPYSTYTAPPMYQGHQWY